MVIIIDTREQKPYSFQMFGVNIIQETMTTGDYSVDGFQDIFAIERKNFDDFIGSISKGRERFKRELERAQDLQWFGIVIECNIDDIKMKKYRSNMHPNSVLGTIRSWAKPGRFGPIPIRFYFAGDRRGGEARTWMLLNQLYQYFSYISISQRRDENVHCPRHTRHNWIRKKVHTATLP